jgi:N-acetylmuramoyl-L-alanine amidase
VIDPGHGGKDPGAVGKTSMEKDIVLAIGLKLGSYIEENIPEVKVVYTRKTDEFIPLYRRAEIANENNADLFISIHANGWSDPSSSGTESLVLGLHRSDENFEVAKRENSVILLEEDYNTRYENFDPNSLESYIIFSLMQNVYDSQSLNFASLVQGQFRERAMRKDRGVRRQGLLVWRIFNARILIETGFISNPDEEKYLASDTGHIILLLPYTGHLRIIKHMKQIGNCNLLYKTG